MSDSQEKDEAIQMESREVPGDPERLRKAFMGNLLSAMGEHYSGYAGITAMKMVLHYLVDNPAEKEHAINQLSTEWEKVATKTLYPIFAKQKIQILETAPGVFEDEDLDKVFQDALKDTSKLVQGALREDWRFDFESSETN